MSFKRVRFQEPEEDIDKSTSFLKMKKRRKTQRTLLPGHEHGKLPFPQSIMFAFVDSPLRFLWAPCSPSLRVITHAGDDEFDEELTEGYRGMADVEDLLWDDELDQGTQLYLTPSCTLRSFMQRLYCVLVYQAER